MRFVEFKLPEKDSPLFNRIFSELSDLVDLAKDLPEDNSVRQQVNAYLEKLKINTGIAEDAVEDAEDALFIAIAKRLPSPQATMALMDIKKFKESVKAELEQVGTAYQDKGKEQVAAASAENRKKAEAVAKKVGKQNTWGEELLAKLNRYNNDTLINDFMDAVINSTGLTTDIVTVASTAKFNFRTIINPKLQGIFDNKEAFKGLVLLPFAEQTAGFGGGVGPGEALLAMLIPNAKRSSSASDLMIGKDIWEVKGGGSDSSKAWLDSATVAPAQLRDIFNKNTSSLRPKYRKIITYTDGSKFTLSQVLDLADFREEKFKFLRTAFRYLDSASYNSIIGEMYAKLYPSVKKKQSKLYAKYVKDTVNAILEGNRRIVADIQAKLGMFEYSVGSYQADNFIIYNYKTHELLVVRGADGIIDSIDNKENLLKTETITMGNSKKSSAGITLISKPGKRAPKAYD